MAFGRKTGVLVDEHGRREPPARGEMLHHRRGSRRAFPETHALREIAAIVRQRHR